MYGIEIENGHKLKCPKCNSIFAIENEQETLYRNITLLHFNTKKGEAKAKCKQCKHMIEIDFSNEGSRIIYVQ